MCVCAGVHLCVCFCKVYLTRWIAICICLYNQFGCFNGPMTWWAKGIIKNHILIFIPALTYLYPYLYPTLSSTYSYSCLYHHFHPYLILFLIFILILFHVYSYAHLVFFFILISSWDCEKGVSNIFGTSELLTNPVRQLEQSTCGGGSGEGTSAIPLITESSFAGWTTHTLHSDNNHMWLVRKWISWLIAERFVFFWDFLTLWRQNLTGTSSKSCWY